MKEISITYNNKDKIYEGVLRFIHNGEECDVSATGKSRQETRDALHSACKEAIKNNGKE